MPPGMTIVEQVRAAHGAAREPELISESAGFAVLRALQRIDELARAGNVAEARERLDQVDVTALPDECRVIVAQLGYLMGEREKALRVIRTVPVGVSGRAMVLACLLGNTAEARFHSACAARELQSDRGTCAEDFLSMDGPAGYTPVQDEARHWGEAGRSLRVGQFTAAHRALLAGYEQFPAYLQGAPQLRLRNGKRLPRWDGRPVDHLAVIIPSAHGDAFWAMRYLPALRTMVKRISVIVTAPTRDIVARCFPDVEVSLPSGCATALQSADAHVTHVMLPWLTGAGYGDARWALADAKLVQRFRIPDDGSLHVGIVWNGSRANPEDHLRSIPIAMLEPLFSVPGVTWYSLQTGPNAAECPPCAIDHSKQLRSFDDTAAVIANLDLVIAIDSAVANLCGAMGAALWALIEYDNDFRWGTDGETTSWFPSARVFRQERAGEWPTVVQRVHDALVDWRNRSGPSGRPLLRKED